MKFKFKKVYWFYSIILLFIALIVWIFMRSAVTDSCSIDLNTCLLKGKTQSFFPRLWSGIICTLKNFSCLIGQLF